MKDIKPNQRIFTSDNHTHIILAGIESMAEAANAAGITLLSITEHISQFTFIRKKVNFASVHETGRMFSSFEEYLSEFQKIRLDLRVRKGLEVDYIENFQMILGDEINREKWDILLCSVHEYSRGIDVEAKGLDQGKKSSSERWSEYFLTQQRALESDFVPFDVLAHPTRLGVSTPVFPEDIDDMLRDLAKLAARRGKALELNGNDLKRMPHLVRKVAEACQITNCRVSLGSDAHYNDQVSRGNKEGTMLVNELRLEVFQ